VDCQINKRNLLKCLGKIQGITEKNPILPMTSNVLIEAKKKEVSISATNFEVGIVLKLEANVVKEGKVVIDAKKSYEIIKEMPEGIICITTEGSEWVKISYNDSVVFNIVGLLEEEFPAIEIEDKIKLFNIDAKKIHKMIKKTVYATSDDKTRDTLRGILVERKKGGIRMVATDGHRLSMSDMEFRDDEGKIIQKSVIIPKKGAREIKRLIEEQEGKKVGVGLGERSIVIKAKDEMMVVRLIEGEFPNYKKVIPIDNKNRMTIKKESLMESIRRVLLVAEEETRTIKFAVEKEWLTMTSRREGTGDVKESLRVDYQGENMDIGLNGRYIIDAIDVIDGEEVTMEVKDEKTPVLIKEKNKEDTIVVIMPMVL